MRVELVAPGPAQLQARHQQIDEPLCVPQFCRRHAIERGVPEDLAGAVGVRCDHQAVDVAVFPVLLVQTGAEGMAIVMAGTPDEQVRAFALGVAAVRGHQHLGAGRKPRAACRQREASSPPEAVEDCVVRRQVVMPADEDRRAGGPHDVALPDVHEREGAREIDRAAEVDRKPGGSELAAEADGGRQQRLARDALRGLTHGHRPPRGSAATSRPAPDECPLRT